jgi:hypothetical protein
MNTLKRMIPALQNDDEPHLLPSQKRAKIIEAVLRESLQDPLSVAQKRTLAIQEALDSSNEACPQIDNEAPPTLPPKAGPTPPRGFSGASTSQSTNTKYQDVRAEEIVLSQHVNDPSQSIGSSSGKTSFSMGAPSSRAGNTDKENDAVVVSVLLIILYKRPSLIYGPQSQSPEGSSLKRLYTAVSLAHTLEGLSDLPNYLRNLEKGHEIKDMKIKHLENEVQR